jgi:hypothetical protein
MQTRQAIAVLAGQLGDLPLPPRGNCKLETRTAIAKLRAHCGLRAMIFWISNPALIHSSRMALSDE